MKKSIILLVVFVAFACGSDQGTQVVIADKSHSLKIPNYLSPAKDLNVDATLQYQNPYKEMYLITIVDKKEDAYSAIVDNGLTNMYSQDFEGYTNLILDGFLESIEDPSAPEIEDMTVNGLNAKRVEIIGSIDNIEVFYLYALVEGKDNYYQILTWTIKDKRDNYLNTMDRIVESFKEL